MINISAFLCVWLTSLYLLQELGSLTHIMEETTDADGPFSNNDISDTDKSEEMILRHRKIMDCAMETFESGITRV